MKLPENVQELINYRIKRASETLEEAEILFQHGRLNAAINRIYYALFYAVLALLRSKNLISSKHSGARALFHKYFVRSNIIEYEFGKFYDKIFDLRHKGDYEDFIVFDKKDVTSYLKEAHRFIERVKSYIDGLENK